MPPRLDVDLLNVARRIAALDSDTVIICLASFFPAIAEIPQLSISPHRKVLVRSSMTHWADSSRAHRRSSTWEARSI